MLILILIYVQYLQNVIFNFEKGSNGQMHSSSGSNHPIKKFPQQNFLFFPTGGGISTTSDAIWKTLRNDIFFIIMGTH